MKCGYILKFGVVGFVGGLDLEWVVVDGQMWRVYL